MLIKCEHLGYQSIVPNKQVLANVEKIKASYNHQTYHIKNLVPSKYELNSVTIND